MTSNHIHNLVGTIDLYDQWEYRDFLKEIYDSGKKLYPFFSYRYMANKLDVDSSFMIRVLQKKVHYPQKSLKKLLELLGLEKHKALFFSELYFFNRAKTEKEAKAHLDKMMGMRNPESRKVNRPEYEYYQKWYYGAIRCLLDYKSFGRDYKSIAKALNPPITTKEAKKAIELLEQLNLIEYVKSTDSKKVDYYKVLDWNLTTGKEWHHHALIEYQTQTIDLAGKSLERVPRDQRDISTLTMNLNLDDLEIIKELTEEYRRKVISVANSSKESQGVYQMNLQVFPLSQIESKPVKNNEE